MPIWSCGTVIYGAAASSNLKRNFINLAYLIYVIFFAFSIPSLGECLDFENGNLGFGWIDCITGEPCNDDCGWVINSTGHNSSWSLRSSEVEGFNSTVICRRVEVEEGPVDVSFWWKLSEDGGSIFFYIDGKYIGALRENDQNSREWDYYITDQNNRIPNGSHIVSWKFQGTKSGYKSQAGWIDDLEIGPCEGFPEVKLVSPDDQAVYYLGDRIAFDYSPDDVNRIEYCDLLIADEEKDRNEIPASGGNYTLYHTFNDTGDFAWKIICCNNLSKCTPARERRITIKDPPPKVSLEDPRDGSTGHQGVLMALNFIPTDNNLKNCTLFINESRTDNVKLDPENGSVNTLEYQFNDTGIYTWSVECCDEKGQCNMSQDIWSVEILKNQPPTVVLISPDDGDDASYVNQTVHFVYRPSDDKKIEYCALIIDGNDTGLKSESPEIGVDDTTFNWIFNTSGRHTWKVVCFDNESAFNVGPENAIIIQKDEPPSVTLLSPQDGDLHYVNQTIEFVYIPADDRRLDRCVLYINGSEEDRNESPTNGAESLLRAEVQQEGNYAWNITCWDDGDNSNFSEDSISVDRPKNVCVYEPGYSQCEAEGYDVNRTKIGDAIRDVLPGGNITVMAGNYTENLVIDKPLVLKGDGGEKPKIYSEEIYLIKVISNNVTVDGFNVTGTSKGNLIDQPSGIFTKGYSDNYLNNITISNNDISARTRFGIMVWRVNDPIIINNNISKFTNYGKLKYGSIGIYLHDCTGGGNISDNNIRCVDGTNSCGIRQHNSTINCGNGNTLGCCNQIDCSTKVYG